jgi:AcrR family transcriptional regulator
MVRPSQGLDESLLRSAAQLYPQFGCAGLSVRKVAEHAGVNPAMLHYHFGNKNAFLRAMLQQLYEGLFSRLSHSGEPGGSAHARLRATLLSFGQFVREQRALVGRLLVDAAAGEPVVREFLQANAPRHLGLLMRLLDEAKAGQPDVPSVQRFVFVMGAVVAPVLVASAALQLKLAPTAVACALDEQALSDAAILQRIDLALAALGLPARRPAKRTSP